MMSKRLYQLLVPLIALGAGTVQADSRLANSRATLEKWVETRQLIGRTRADWAADKEALKQSVALLEKEIALLNDQIAQTEASAGEGQKERRKLLEEQEAMRASVRVVSETIDDLEKRLLTLSSAFPKPLMEQIQPLTRRIPQTPDAAAPSLSQRMQNLVAILNEVDRFNGSITLVSELRKTRSGEEFQVKTLYLGLAQAYFVDKTKQIAGVGAPGIGGWHWTDRNELAPKVARAIAIYENEQPAAFVSLPVSIK